MKRIEVSELALRTAEAMLKMGLTPQTVWNEYGRTFLPIVRMHTERGIKEFDREIISDYVRMIEGRVERGEITAGYYRNLKYGAHRMTEMYDNGKLEWSAPIKASRFTLNKYYEKILEQFVAGEDVSPKVKGDLTWVGKKYFFWLIQEGHSNLKKVGADEVQRFMIYCSKHMVKIKDAALYKLTHVFFKEYLQNLINRSPNTIYAYREALNARLDFVKTERNIDLSEITFDMLNQKMII